MTHSKTPTFDINPRRVFLIRSLIFTLFPIDIECVTMCIRLKFCCCGLNLQEGCRLIARFGIIMNVLHFGSNVAKGASGGFNGVDALTSVLGAGIHGMLLYGVIKRKPAVLLAFFVVATIAAAFLTVFYSVILILLLLKNKSVSLLRFAFSIMNKTIVNRIFICNFRWRKMKTLFSCKLKVSFFWWLCVSFYCSKSLIISVVI